MKIKTIALVGSAIVATLFGGVSAHAAGNDYSVQAVVPASQIDKSNASYFDLKLNGGQSETLTFNLQNTSDKTLTSLRELQKQLIVGQLTTHQMDRLMVRCQINWGNTWKRPIR